ncbi:disease resistance protein RPM1-like [Prunus yedoensis var. nudiflora]|uniref:Disease resistance protein RPM1-like n=1 Tax=Prunus yedoensis var. nudiflora TaxID=2094558 RepID=A0A314UZ29_PRUYE|nr:disease resistance protein RPM1-like [Prunus yedoensis var. nudiflora]
MGKLVNIETLDLKQSLVHEIPIEISKLPKLRSLLAYNVDKNKDFSLTRRRGVVIQDGIECWGIMQKLCAVEASDSLVKEVGNLKQLRRFRIQKLTSKQGKDLYASIGQMPHLRSLEVKAINGDEIIDLQHISSPPQCLQVLSLMGRLEKIPDWIAGLCLLFVDMPSHFMDEIHVQETEHRVGPRVFFGNTKGINGLSVDEVIDSAIFD